jgi:hypothetical protein
VKKEVSIVLSREASSARNLAEQWYNLTGDQMEDRDVHHNPPRHQGGRNIPEHLYVYHNSLHSAVHEDDFTKWSRVGGERGGKKVHEKKNEEGKSVHGVKTAESTNAEKDELGRSINAVKGGTKGAKSTHAQKDKQGRSINAVKGAESCHLEKNEQGKSKVAVKMGQAGAKTTTAQVWVSTVDGFRSNSGNVARHNKSRGWDPNARVQVG